MPNTSTPFFCSASTAPKELFPVLIKSSITTTGTLSKIFPSICLPAPCDFGPGQTYINGLFKLSAMSIPIAIDPVATPAT